MSSLDCYATQFQYLDHLAPILRLVPHRLFVPNRLLAYAKQRGLKVSLGKPPQQGGPVLVASYHDSRAVRYRPRIYLEHGSGQTYSDVPRHPCYSGGEKHDGTVLFLCPSETVAARWREHYDVPAVSIGSPKLDALRDVPIGDEVAISFHSNVDLVPETRNAFPHYAPILKELSERFPLIGHAHPRLMRRIKPFYEANGIEVVEDFSEVVRRAGVYCVDNSSTGFEALELGRPVVWMNSPDWRRGIHHGLRFWGVQGQIDTPEALPEAIEQRQFYPMEGVYDYHDDRASERAVAAIEQHLPL